MFDSKLNNNRMENAETDLDIELQSYRNEGAIRFPERQKSLIFCTPHKFTLNLVRCCQVACIAMLYISWRRMKMIGVDLADVA